jgi:ferredoxin
MGDAMAHQDSSSPAEKCVLCRRPAPQWFLRISIEDAGGLCERAFICPNCAVKLRLASAKNRDLQVDPWVHDAVARVLRGQGEE